MLSKQLTLVLAFLFIAFSMVNAAIINVPDDQSTIQLGIDASTNSDTVLVQPGTYVENINFSGKNIVVGSLFLTTQDTSYISSTIIDGNENGSVVKFESGESTDAALIGFSIINGLNTQGGGIYVYGSGATLKNLRIKDNGAWDNGGGLCLYSNDNSVVVSDCIIKDNYLTYSIGRGAGITFGTSTTKQLLMTNTLIAGHSAAECAGIYTESGNAVLINCTVTNNIAGSRGGAIGIRGSDCHIDIFNSILSNNFPEEVYVLTDVFPVNTLNASYSLLGEGWLGESNIVGDPAFINTSEYSLSSNSPCIGAGIDSIEIDEIWYYAPDTDINGNPRPNPASSKPDIGAYENPLGEPDPLPSVTFRVDMSNEVVSENGVHVGGTFNGWIADSTELTDPDGDNIYTCTLVNENYGFYKDEVIEYKFINNNSWAGAEYISGNRFHTITGGIDSLPSVCFGYAVPCDDVPLPRVWHIAVDGNDESGDGTILNPLATIQAGIDSSKYSDTLLVHPGTFNGPITVFGGRNLVIGSKFLTTQDTSYITSTIIDGSNSYSVFALINNDPIKLKGLTIQNGSAQFGAGIYIFNSRVILENVRVKHNDASLQGGGIHLKSSQIEIVNSIISDNSESSDGGAGLFLSQSDAIIAKTIIGNNAGTNWGGGILLVDQSNLVLMNSIVNNNTSNGSGGGFAMHKSEATIINSDVVDNPGSVAGGIFANGATVNLFNSILQGHDSEIWAGDSSIINIQYSFIQDYKIHNYDESASFDNKQLLATNSAGFDPIRQNYQLSNFSPCIGAGADSAEIDGTWYYANSVDIDGNPRPNPAGSNPDIGAYENPLAEPIKFVESVYPAQNALNVSQNTDISVTFGTDIDPASINSQTFVVHASQTGLHGGTYSYNSVTRTTILELEDEFAPGEAVNITLTSDVRSSDGFPIIPFQWSFTIETFGGSGTFLVQDTISLGEYSSVVFTTDLDSDGDMDIIAVNPDLDNISVLFNAGDATFGSPLTIAVGDYPWAGSTADLDSDGDNDIIVVNHESNNISVVLNNGNSTFADQYFVAVGVQPVSVFPVDLDADGDIDLITPNRGSDNISLLSNNGDGTFEDQDTVTINGGPRSIFSTDLDSDGDMDIITANANSDNIAVLINIGNGTFTDPQYYMSGAAPLTVFSADFDADGDMDIVSTNYESDNISLFSNEGDGTFIEQTTLAIGDSPYSLFSTDLDSDGNLDIISSYMIGNNISVLINNGNGTFQEHDTIEVSDNTRSVFSADLDSDGDMDIITANWDFNNISILLNISTLSVNFDLDTEGEQSEIIQFGYIITNPESNTINLLCEYSIDHELTWYIATVSGDTTDLNSEAWTGTLTWDSYADLPGQDISNVNFRLTPYSDTETGWAGTVSFHLDNNRVPFVVLASISGEQRLDIDISYQLSDTETDSLGLLCEYYDPSTSVWRTATVTGDTAGIESFAGQIIWNSLSDLPIAFGEGLFRITPYDNDPGVADTVEIFLDQLGLAAVSSISNYSTELSGDITVDYQISDDEEDDIDLHLEYSSDSGTNWDTANVTGAVSGLTSSNYSGNLIWHSKSDLPGIDITTIRLRLTPNDGNPGFPLETEDFHLDNNLPPAISEITIPDTIAVLAALAYDLTDMENDTLSLEITYSTDQGTTWFGGESGFGTYKIYPGGYSDSFDWYTYESFGFQRLQDVWVNFSVSDNDPGSDTTLKNISILNYPAEYTGDLEITAEDLAIFAAAWNAEPQDLIYEIGPASGSVPELTPEPDGIMNVEDLAVFIQMWNWSFTNNGLKKPHQLAKTSLESSSWLDFETQSPEDVWTSNGSTSVSIETEREDILQVELIVEQSSPLLSVNFMEGDYFEDRFLSSPVFKEVSNDSTLSSCCITGLGVQDVQNGSGTIAELDLSNLTGSTETVYLLYRIWSISGAEVESGQISLDVESQVPDKYTLEQNFPNPFNPSTTIRYTLPEATEIRLNIYNIRGELVQSLVSEHQEAGYYQLTWSGESARGAPSPAGLYFCRIQTPQFTETKKMVFLK
ncbi:MAG: FG-GAP-like repeat-containing protein [Candidatus Marinimicrobia bacterium]|nr:FG-GAP-like repeat-containing protein [Candidatus Neomarinimicrobiota bacterium]